MIKINNNNKNENLRLEALNNLSLAIVKVAEALNDVSMQNINISNCVFNNSEKAIEIDIDDTNIDNSDVEIFDEEFE
jgi:hypothetical protein